MTFTARLDAYQRRHSWLGLPIAVFYKFFDDQGGYLTALITYYGFLSLFPLLLVAVTILGFAISGNPQTQHDVISSALGQFPIIGKQIQTDVHGYTGSGLGLAVGLLGAVYGGLGIAQASQNALNSVWAVPRHARPNPIKSRLRSLVALTVFGVGVIVTSGISALATASSHYGVEFGIAGRVLAAVLAALVNVALFTAAFRFLTAKSVTVRDVLLGAVIAGVAWQVLQALGSYYVDHKLRGAREVYGVFGLVLGLVAWIYLEALVLVLCAELNVVRRRHLWPRSLLTPFTDNVSLTEADQHAYGSYAQAQQHKGFETIDVGFGDGHDGDGGGDDHGGDLGDGGASIGGGAHERGDGRSGDGAHSGDSRSGDGAHSGDSRSAHDRGDDAHDGAAGT